jgi:hypothetical protein
MDPRLREISIYLLAQRSAADVQPSLLDRALLPHLFVLDIIRGDPLRLRVRLAGTALDRAFGRTVTDRFMDEFLHGPRSRDVLAMFQNCAKTRAPVWMRQVVRVKDALPRFVEGVAVFLPEDRIYGGLAFGEVALRGSPQDFESVPLGAALFQGND